MSSASVLSDAITAMRWQTLAPVLHDAFVLSSRPAVVANGLARVGDPEATRTVYATVVILVLLGIALLGLAVWVFRRTRPESALLAPLETMQTRSWRKLDPAAQRRMLDEVRPSGAAPLKREASEPTVDSSFATVAPIGSFDDLSDVDDSVIDDTTSGDRDVAEADEAVLDPTVDAQRPRPGHEADEHDEHVDRAGDPDTDVVPEGRGGADVADLVDGVEAGDDGAPAGGLDDTGELPDSSEFGLDFDDDDLDDPAVDADVGDAAEAVHDVEEIDAGEVHDVEETDAGAVHDVEETDVEEIDAGEVHDVEETDDVEIHDVDEVDDIADTDPLVDADHEHAALDVDVEHDDDNDHDDDKDLGQLAAPPIDPLLAPKPASPHHLN